MELVRRQFHRPNQIIDEPFLSAEFARHGFGSLLDGLRFGVAAECRKYPSEARWRIIPGGSSKPLRRFRRHGAATNQSARIQPADSPPVEPVLLGKRPMLPKCNVVEFGSHQAGRCVLPQWRGTKQLRFRRRFCGLNNFCGDQQRPQTESAFNRVYLRFLRFLR